MQKHSEKFFQKLMSLTIDKPLVSYLVDKRTKFNL